MQVSTIQFAREIDTLKYKGTNFSTSTDKLTHNGIRISGMRFTKAQVGYRSFYLAIFKIKTLSFKQSFVNLSPGVENYYSIEANNIEL